MDIKSLGGELKALRETNAGRDARMDRIARARTPGGLRLVYPDMFPAEGPYAEPMAANMVDIAARDIAEVLAPLPSISCSSAKNVSDRARKFAEKRSKIAQGYADASKLQTAMYTAADRYVTYGHVVGVVALDWDRQTPVIQFPDPRGCYLLKDRFDRLQRVYWVRRMNRLDAEYTYPELRAFLASQYHGGDVVEIVRWHDATSDGVFCPTGPGMVLKEVANPVGEVLAHQFKRPGLLDEEIGQFDDVLAVQVAKARFALLALEAAQKSVQAPLALPTDVQEMSLGPDAVIKSTTPEKIRRVGLDVPPAAFAEQAQLDQELRQGSRYPDARAGNVDQSIITGKGVQALMSGFDTQIRTGQAIFADGLSSLVSKCFAADEKVWPDTEKTLRGNDNGTPYEIKYRPAKDINGDHTVDAQYGLMAGLNPNQALVFGLQARGDKLISRDFLRRQMPFALDATEEEQKVDVEEMRDALKQSVQGYAQAIPALAQQGQDPSDILRRMATMIEDRQKGIPIEESVVKAFAPPEEEQQMAGMPGMPGMGEPGMAGGAGGLPPGLGPEGLMTGVAPGQAGMAPGGRPDVMGLLANLGPRGQGNLEATVSRRAAI